MPILVNITYTTFVFDWPLYLCHMFSCPKLVFCCTHFPYKSFFYCTFIGYIMVGIVKKLLRWFLLRFAFVRFLIC